MHIKTLIKISFFTIALTQNFNFNQISGKKDVKMFPADSCKVKPNYA